MHNDTFIISILSVIWIYGALENYYGINIIFTKYLSGLLAGFRLTFLINIFFKMIQLI